MIEGILIEGLIYGLMVLGVFITFRILDFADLTVDGSFPMGAAIMAVLLIKGVNPVIAVLLSFAGGMTAGLITAVIHTKLKIPGLLAGILTMTMLYSVNLRIMSNRANLSLLRVPTVFTWLHEVTGKFMNPELAIVLFLVAVVLIAKILLDLFFHTDFGLTMGALGSNPQLIISQGMNPEIIKGVGICIANGLVAAAGAFASMYQGFADVGSGTGIVVSGLASVMIGEFLIRTNKISLLTLRVVLGSIVYRMLMYFARSYGYLINMSANDLKLITGLLIVICLIISRTDIINKWQKKKSRKAYASVFGASSDSAQAAKKCSDKDINGGAQ
ncbi:MAG TPA: ABC transporter permease [Treponemataceae bacterium]|jgi:putative ABC transport system permease protein|nr:ABC transporter permease [Treponemataceae bacterium]